MPYFDYQKKIYGDVIVTQALAEYERFLRAYSTIKFCLSSGWQEVFIPPYLSFFYSHECNRRCYF